MKLYASMYSDSDGCTYQCDVLLGVFDDLIKAGNCNGEHCKSRGNNQYDYSVDEIELNETLWAEREKGF